MGAIQRQINNVLGSFGAVALATNRYNQGVNASEDKARALAEKTGAEVSENMKAEGEASMKEAIKQVQKAQKEKQQQAQMSRQIALTQAQNEIQAKFTQKQEN